MQELLLKVLEPTKVDWKEFTKEELINLAPTLEGKPVNIDHNKIKLPFPDVIGEVEKVFVNENGEIFAIVQIFDDVYDEIKDKITSCSFEWNPSPTNKESIFKGLALTLYSNAKVKSAAILGHIVASRYEEGENMTETNETSQTQTQDKETKPETVTLTKEELDRLITEKVSQAISNIKTEKSNENTGIEASNTDKLDVLTDRVNDLAASVKTLIKKMESSKGSIEASKLPNTKNNESVDICNTRIEFDF
jgi:outer membrane murein-binding lipoprotein Lpp